MWDRSDETPPQSPGPSTPVRPTPSATRSSHQSEYYRRLNTDRQAQPTSDWAETEYGWAGHFTAAYKDSAPRVPRGIRHPEYLSGSDDQARQGGGVSLRALIDPQDIETSTEAHLQPMLQTSNTSSFFLQLVGCLGYDRRKDTLAKSRFTSSAELERQEARNMREAALAKRRARGSIMYERTTGLAQIPLYAAPIGEHISRAPALSSFAPRAPLGGKALGSTKAIATASATLNGEGTVLEIKKEKPFDRKGNRYSVFVRKA